MNAPPFSQVPGVRSMLVLRPNAVGDFVFALPALHALKHAYPEAQLVYIGKQWHADFLTGRPGPVDKVLVMPPYPGVGEPPGHVCEREPAARFVADLREARFDLALQMFGGGRYSNAFMMQLGARLTAGTRTADAAPLDRSIAYGPFSNRRLELLRVAALVGATTLPGCVELEVTPQDRALAARVLPPLAGERLVLLHPGASDPRRRWPAERFAEVADQLASAGARILVSGTMQEAALVRSVIKAMHFPALDLSDQLPLPALCGLLERAAILVSNDTGPLHLALAIGTPCVGIFWLTNLVEAGPLRQELLRPALSVRVHCPVCGMENRHTRCAHDVCFVDDVSVQEVSAMAADLYRSATS